MAAPKYEFVISAKDQTKQAFDSVVASVGKVNGLIGSIGLIGGAGLATALVASVRSAADFADEMGKVAQKVGVTTESISGLKFAADLSDVSFESLQIGLKKLSQNAFEAADGNKALAADFKRLGIDVLASNGALKSSDTLLLELADKFATMQNGAEKTALAVKLLGKSGTDLIPFLNSGAAGIKQLTDEAERFGVVVTQDNARAAEEFNDNLTRIEAAGRGLAIQFGNELIPAFAELTTKTVENIKQLGIFKGLLVSLADGVEIGIFGSEQTQRAERIADLTEYIVAQQAALSNVAGDSKVADNIRSRIAEAKKEFQELVKLQSSLQKPNTLPKPAEDKPAFTPTGGGGKSQAVKDAEAAAKAAQAFIDKLKEQAATLGLSDEALLRYELSQQKLNKSQLAAAESAIAQITAFKESQKAIQDALADDKIFKEGDDRALQLLEEQSRLEAETQATREADFENFYNNLVSQNEQLNIDLITDDKKRAQAQIELENQRAIERIQNLGLENDQIEILLAEQADIFAKQTKELATKGTSDFEDLTRAVRGFGDDAARTLTDFVTTGKAEFGDLVKSILDDLARLTLQKKVLDPLFEGLDSFLGGFDFGSFFTANANGNVYSGPGINRYSNSVVSKPTLFPFAKGIGLMGEAGPEAILPLTRVNGQLGVKATGGSGDVTVNVSVNASNTSVQGDGKQANELGRLIGAAVQSELIKQKRPGGILA